VKCDPISKRTIILFHDDNIGVTNNSVVIHCGDTFIKSKILQTADFSEDVV
jgi:hypothetical protein